MDDERLAHVEALLREQNEKLDFIIGVLRRFLPLVDKWSRHGKKGMLG